MRDLQKGPAARLSQSSLVLSSSPCGAHPGREPRRAPIFGSIWSRDHHPLPQFGSTHPNWGIGGGRELRPEVESCREAMMPHSTGNRGPVDACPTSEEKDGESVLRDLALRGEERCCQKTKRLRCCYRSRSHCARHAVARSARVKLATVRPVPLRSVPNQEAALLHDTPDEAPGAESGAGLRASGLSAGTAGWRRTRRRPCGRSPPRWGAPHRPVRS